MDARVSLARFSRLALVAPALCVALAASGLARAEGGIPNKLLRGVLALQDDTAAGANTAQLGIEGNQFVLRGEVTGFDVVSEQTVDIRYEARLPDFIQSSPKQVALEQAKSCTVFFATEDGYTGALNTGAKGDPGDLKKCSCAGVALAKNGKGLKAANVSVECPDALPALAPIPPDEDETEAIRGAFLGRKDVKVKKSGDLLIFLEDTCVEPGPCLKDADFTVTTDADSGAGSLRQALADAAATPGAVITFDKGLFGGSVGVETPLLITEDVTILGPGVGPDAIAIDGQELTRIFDVDTDVSLTVENLSLVRGNEPAVLQGGAIRSDGTVTLRDVRVASCRGRFGGAVRQDGGTDGAGVLTLERVEMIDNVAVEGFGGAINNNSSNVVIRDSRLARNRAQAAGAGAILTFGDGVTTIENSTLDGNIANGPGGAIFHLGDTGFTLVRNSTLVGNASIGNNAEGGAIAQDGGAVTLISATLVGNTDVSDAATTGGGVARSDGILNVSHTVIADNVAGNAAQSDLSAGAINSTDTANFIGGEPKLGPLAPNEGRTPTMLPLPGSPLIDAGTGGLGSTRDQRGRARVSDGDGDSIALPDIGAAERI
jgi:hypothetical protein